MIIDRGRVCPAVIARAECLNLTQATRRAVQILGHLAIPLPLALLARLIVRVNPGLGDQGKILSRTSRKLSTSLKSPQTAGQLPRCLAKRACQRLRATGEGG